MKMNMGIDTSTGIDGDAAPHAQQDVGELDQLEVAQPRRSGAKARPVPPSTKATG